jgi:hypothetical protein
MVTAVQAWDARPDRSRRRVAQHVQTIASARAPRHDPAAVTGIDRAGRIGRPTRSQSSEKSAPRKATPPVTRPRARGLAAERWRIERFACGRPRRPRREFTGRIIARSVARQRAGSQRGQGEVHVVSSWA